MNIIKPLSLVLIGLGLGCTQAHALSPRSAIAVAPLAATHADHAWLEIDIGAFRHNLLQLDHDLAGDAKVCAILKGDAYGHGLSLLMPAVIAQGIGCIGVASNEELRLVRASGFSGRLLRVRTATVGEIDAAMGDDVEELIGNLDLARAADAIARRHGRPLKFHLALNSAGMSRNGLDMTVPKGMSDALAIVAMPGLKVSGIMTHFPVEERGDVATGLRRFEADALAVITQAGLDRSTITLHCANSFATLEVPESRLDMVRPGGLLFGDAPAGHAQYRRVMQFKSRVATVGAYQAGNTVGYGRTVTLERPSLLANVPVGYSDGYPAALGNKTHVLVSGKRAPVIGRVSMNTMMIDVTDIPGVRGGEEVVLFGRQGSEEITQAELEHAHGDLLADLYTVWGNSNPKIVR